MVRTIVVYVLHINDHMNVYLTYFSYEKGVFIQYNTELRSFRAFVYLSSIPAPARKTAVALVQSTLSGGSLCHATRLDWLLISWPSCR